MIDAGREGYRMSPARADRLWRAARPSPASRPEHTIGAQRYLATSPAPARTAMIPPTSIRPHTFPFLTDGRREAMFSAIVDELRAAVLQNSSPLSRQNVLRDCSSRYFPSMFAALRMGDQRAISAFTKLLNFAG